MIRTIVTTTAAAGLALASASAAVYSSGHADYGVGYEGGELHFHFHAEGATVDGIEVDDQEYDIPDVITLVSSTAMMTLPIDFPALGASAGQSIWVLPEVQNIDLPFLGLATEELAPADWGNLTFTLGAVTAPGGAGEFAVWQSGSFGELLLRMSTADPGADAITLLPGNHSHYNYGFSKPGIWQVEMTVSGTHVTDGFKSDTQTLTFQVVPEPSAALLGGLGVFGLLVRRRR
jgi:surface-anchored protein